MTRTDLFFRFEYDRMFFGGDYDKVGDFALVPQALVEELGHEEAFESHTGIDRQHIIHYSCDELYTADGEEAEV